MMDLQKRSNLDYDFGKKFNCSIIGLILASCYILLNLTWTLMTRLYIKTYYTSAFVAGWAVIIGIFLFFHHGIPVHKALGVTTYTYGWIKVTISAVYLVSWMACALGYTILTGLGIHLNFDHFGAMFISWANAFIFFYIFIVCIHILRDDRKHRPLISEEDPDKEEPLKMKKLLSEEHPPYHEVKVEEEKGASVLCCLKHCLYFLYRFIYILIHILLLTLLMLTIYYPYAVVDNVIKYRNDSYMYTVQVGDHRPLTLFMRCRGNGTDTVMLQYSLLGEAYVYWDLLAKQLSDYNYTTCVYDRRGIGWSEGINHDWPSYIKEPQTAEYEVDFLKALVEVADVQKPLYFVGHGNAAYDATFMALKYPQYVKGLIFLDGNIDRMIEYAKEFYATSRLHWSVYIQLIMQLKQLGIVHIIWDNYLPFIKDIVESQTPFRLGAETVETLQNIAVCMLKNGNYFSTTYRMFVDLVLKPFAQDSLIQALGNQSISQPILSLGSRYSNPRDGSKWLKMVYEQVNFKYDTVDTGHMSMVLDYDGTGIVAYKIDEFIKSM